MSFKRIWVMSDLHGTVSPIESFCQRNKIMFSKNTDCIILLGDVGANYYLNLRDKIFKNKLETLPFTYFCIRGNHEARPSTLNREDWNIEQFFGGSIWVENDYPNIKYAMDYPCVYNIEGYKTLIIPGAYSVDKYYRLTKGWSWFKDEQLSEKEMSLGRKIISKASIFDIVLSHTCPICYEPTDLFLPMIDQSMVDKTMERYLGEIEFKINYKLWLWGHYHAYRRYPMDKENRLRIMLSAGEEALLLENLMNEKTNKVETKY